MGEDSAVLAAKRGECPPQATGVSSPRIHNRGGGISPDFTPWCKLLLVFLVLACTFTPTAGVRDIAVSATRGPINDLRVQCAAVTFIVAEVGLWQKVPLERVLRRCAERLDIIHVTTKTLRRWYTWYQKYGEVPVDTERWRSRRRQRKKKSNKRKPRSDYWPTAHLNALQEIIDEHPEYYLDEIQSAFYEITKVKKSGSSIWTALHKHLAKPYSLQVVTYIAAERDEEERAEYLHELRACVRKPEMAIFVDETAKDRNSARRRRIWAVRGSKAEFSQPLSGEGLRYTMMGACDVNGFVLEACEPIFQKRSDQDKDESRGTVDTERFIEWVEEFLVPTLGVFRYGEPHSVVILDNAPIHHHPEVIRLIEEEAKAKIIYTARYSPDLNPIEYFFKVYKDSLKRDHVLAKKDALKAHRRALISITPEKAANIFRKCFVPLPDGVGTEDEEGAGVGTRLVRRQIALDFARSHLQTCS